MPDPGHDSVREMNAANEKHVAPKKGCGSRLRSGWGRRAIQLYVLIYFIYIILPLFFLVLYAFNTSEYLVWPLEGFTSEWFVDAFTDSRLVSALTNSVIIASATMVFSAIVGTALAYGLVRYRFRGKAALETLNILAIITYGIVVAVALLLWFRTLGIPGGIWPTILGHTVFIFPFAVLVIRDRLLNFDLELEEAAMDLGATQLRTFFDITLPLIAPAILAAGLFCFTISLGEFLLSFFLIGHELTLPVYLYGKMRFGFTPAVNAAATAIVAFPTLVVIIVALFFRREVESIY
jgi:spermidine/putrescine transport system permease protein